MGIDMKTTREDGLLLEAKIVGDGKQFHVDCRIEDGDTFRYGSYASIQEALGGMTIFLTCRVHEENDDDTIEGDDPDGDYMGNMGQ